MLSPTGNAFGRSSADVEDRVWELVGAQVIRVAPAERRRDLRSLLVLSGDLELERFCDTELDPWVRRADESTVIAVSEAKTTNALSPLSRPPHRSPVEIIAHLQAFGYSLE
jgi:hypothetical protein